MMPNYYLVVQHPALSTQLQLDAVLKMRLQSRKSTKLLLFIIDTEVMDG